MGVAWGFGAVASALMLLCVNLAHADTAGPDGRSFLLFAGTDLWRDGAFLHGGLLWSPGGFDADGFTLKLLLAGGGYTYPSGGLHTDVDGTLVSASALPGWRVISDGITITLYAGPMIQDYRLSPYDPGSLLHGFYSGAQIAADVWYQPSPASMVAINGTIASIAAIGTMRAAVGWQFDQPFFVGPEAQALWCIDYQQWRLGAHVTGFRLDGLDWSASAGWAVESIGRAGPYLRLGVNTRF